MCYEFKKWNSDDDVIVKGKNTLLSNEHPVVTKHIPWAYALNTSVGFYFMDTHTTSERHVIRNLDGEEIVFVSENSIMALNFTDLNGTIRLFDDVTIWAHNFYDDFMIVTLHKTDQTILIDSRGIPFELPLHGVKHFHRSTIEKNKREGFYLIEKSVVVYYKTKEEHAAFIEKTNANPEVVFNKEFNRFIRNNTKNTTEYLYLTAGNSKCGALVQYFIAQGMQYEIVPNVIVDDDTVNIRIPLEGENAFRKDVQFLCAKYPNTYSIYNIPYTEIGGTLELTEVQKKKHERLKISFQKSLTDGRETITYYIVNTLRSIFNTADDYEVYKKVFSKIVRMIKQDRSGSETNCFSKLLLLHPSDYQLNDKYVTQRMDYIDSLLSSNGLISWDKLYQEKDSKYMFCEPRIANSFTYKIAYDFSKKRFQQEMSSFESNALYEISKSGGVISKWTSEATLFALVKKEYPDAIFQYHPEWLILQSLDIYIPSLRVGIEYQGEQHYHPVEIFGGEDGFKSLVKRDRRKIQLCSKNDVALIHWKYDEVISVPRLNKKIREVLDQ